MKSPIVLIIYKRDEILKKQIMILRKVKPNSIFIIADGAKTKEEQKQCQNARLAIKEIKWPCQIHKNYATSNMGLKRRFSTGLSWVFSKVDRAIILEDDCIPDPSFFKFCDTLLEKYKSNQNIMTISGNNFQKEEIKSKDSYYYSKYPHVWGWATWKRVWDLYDPDIEDWPERRETNWIREVSEGYIISKFWKYIFNRLYRGLINTWDYQLTYLSFKQGGVNIIPRCNLVSNYGYGVEATNTRKKNKVLALPTKRISFPLNHPKKISINNHADHYINNLVYLNTIGKISLFLKSILGML